MAGTGGATVGPQSPLNRNLERLLEEAQISCELRVSSHRLREFPKVACKYNLNDTVYSGKGSPFFVTTFDSRYHGFGVMPALFCFSTLLLLIYFHFFM